MTFDYLPVRLLFMALDVVHFPAGKAGNVLRGAFGMAPAGARLFRPPARTDGPSGLADPPRPFALRPRTLDGWTFAAGHRFAVEVHLFDLRREACEELVEGFREAVAGGIGPGRGRVRLEGVDRPAEALRIPLDPGDPVSRLAIEFLSPTELKPPGPPEFPTVYARARDRVSTLRTLYGEGPLALDFRAAGDRARQVRMTRCDVRQVDIERRSYRTGQTHGIGGFIGEAAYEGDLGEFLPLLLAAQATGIGRHTVWGNGEISVRAG